MITRLVEKKKLKAHQYWPDSEGEDWKLPDSPPDPHLGKEVAPVLDIGGGCKVEHVSTSYQGTYFLRQADVKIMGRTSVCYPQEVHCLAG